MPAGGSKVMLTSEQYIVSELSITIISESRVFDQRTFDLVADPHGD